MSRYILVALMFLCSCGTKKTEGENATKDTIASQNDSSAVTAGDIDTTAFETYFIVIADTSPDYYSLQAKMFMLNKKLGIPIDTMGRYYNASKDLIALPDDDEDEIFAGDYAPRRFPSVNLSLEYLGFYTDHLMQKTIALVTGIYETEKSADSAVSVLKQYEKNSFKEKSLIYTGCIH